MIINDTKTRIQADKLYTDEIANYETTYGSSTLSTTSTSYQVALNITRNLETNTKVLLLATYEFYQNTTGAGVAEIILTIDDTLKIAAQTEMTEIRSNSFYYVQELNAGEYDFELKYRITDSVAGQICYVKKRRLSVLELQRK